MLTRDRYSKICEDCPTIIPVFRLSRVPRWAEGKVSVGDEFTEGDLCISRIDKNGRFLGNFDIGPSYLTFVEYRQISGVTSWTSGSDKS